MPHGYLRSSFKEVTAMNNNDQSPAAKGMYQFPTTLSQETVSFDTPEEPEYTEEQVERQFKDIVREDIRQTYNDIMRANDLGAIGIEASSVSIDVAPEHMPEALDMLAKGDEIIAHRQALHAKLSRNMSDARRADVMAKIVEAEDTYGAKAKIFPTDPEVSNVKFFLLPEGDVHKWFMQQTSAVKAKNFTNSYTLLPHAVDKSSTYFDETHGRIRNVAVTPSRDEILTLRDAVTRYHSVVIENVYTTSASSKNRIKSFGLRRRTK